MNVDDLVARSKQGHVTESEIEAVARLLSSRRDHERAYSLLYVLARSFATEHEELVAGFLDHRDDPTLARLALQTLCSSWELGEKYADEMRRFIDGVPWDHLGDVRPVAISAAGVGRSGRGVGVRRKCHVGEDKSHRLE